MNSKEWIKKRNKDKYFLKAKKYKLRSRSWFKIKEIQKEENLFYCGMSIIDLGSSPGGWSQYISTKIKQINIIACDKLNMNHINNVKFIKGDFLDIEIQNKIIKLLKNQKVQIIISDMSPNISGISIIDISKFNILIESILIFCKKILIYNGNLLIKVFQGEGIYEIIQKIKKLFKFIKIKKPKSSKNRSREIYIIAKQKK